MILIIHAEYKVTQILEANEQPIFQNFVGKFVAHVLIDICIAFPKENIIWCLDSFKNDLNQEAFETVFHHHRIFASFNPFESHYLPKQIGYVERSYYLKVNKEVTFPTWLMSSYVGGLHASVIQNLKNDLKPDTNFDYFLNSLAKRAMVEGLFCYSEPLLLKPNIAIRTDVKSASIYTLFKFVKQHYKWFWVFFLAFSFLIYERKLLLLPLFKSLFFKQLSTDFNIETIPIISSRKVIVNKQIDVVIPTIGRKTYLYDVLKDLSKQTLLPKNVIIVEQNPNVNSVSELDYLTAETWPFRIKHTFTHRAGVCNARNSALGKVESEWILLGDDDNRFDVSLIETIFNEIEKIGTNVGNTAYLQPNEIQTFLKTAQTSIFGAGNSVIKSSLLERVSFDKRYEFNYGEDTDFGMQLRLLGEDVIYFANIKITHLKAPIGGYRTKINQLWQDDAIVPKPSPTIYLLNSTYFTNPQLLGYKLLLALKSYKNSEHKNPITYIKHFNKKWQQSQFWSEKLTNNHNA